MALDEYGRKRKFRQTPEPPARPGRTPEGNRFVVQMHHATRLHFDFRLEMDGVLKSWAVPKGPTLDPSDKRLAMMVEDHPVDYLLFEGIIPAGNYGAGTVMVWDTGKFEFLTDTPPQAMLEKGDLKFRLQGEKLQGEFALVRLKSRRPGSKGTEWLLLKKKDAYAQPGWNAGQFDRSVLSGRSLLEIAADAGSATWGNPPSQGAMARAAARTIAFVAKDLAGLPGAQEAEMPESVRPMMAVSSAGSVEGEDWLQEIKWDGVRAIAYLRDGAVRLVSRNLRDITQHYPDLSGMARQVNTRRAILDGEIVCLEPSGRSSFERLQQRMNLRAPNPKIISQCPVTYYAFDLVYADGYDLRQVPLEKRKETLRALLRPESGPEDRLRYSDHHAGEGGLLFRLAQEQGLEGLIAKRRQSRYREERSSDWVKIKTTRRQECVVCGWTDPRGSRPYFGALLLGLFRGKRLVCVGSVGSGFDQQSQKMVWDRLQEPAGARMPFDEMPETRERPHWVKPKLVAEVKFAEWTSDGKMRAPVFLGLRADKAPEDCLWEEQSAPAQQEKTAVAGPLFLRRKGAETVEVDGRRMTIQNLDKVFFPQDGYTKADVIEYYFRIAAWLLPHMHDKPVSMKRYPNGIDQPYFFQKEAGEAMPGWVRTEAIPKHQGGRETIRYVICNERATLVYLANLGCIDQNPWMSRYGSLDHPDFVLFDLDPGERLGFEALIEVARAFREIFSRLEVEAYPKTSGASGLHIYLPLEPVYSYEQARSFAEVVCRLVEQEIPGLITHERSLNKRPPDRVYLDYLQIGWGKTVPPPYSLRPHPGATVSTPLEWKEVKPGLDPRNFTIKAIWERLETGKDLFEGTLKRLQRLEAAVERLPEMLPRKKR